MTAGLVTWMVVAGFVAAVWVFRYFALGYAERHRLALCSDSHPDFPSSPLRVSVIVAAKDEETNIESCIRSLLEQDYPDLQVIAVDDRSSDRTPTILARLAREFGERLRVVTIHQLPEGWSGKNHAMHEGFAVSDGHWLLFTDADCTYTSRRAITVAVREAESSGSSFLSMMPVLETRATWERIIQPVCTAVLIMWFVPSRVNDPRTKTAYANGAFMLLTRSCYEAIGGHKSVQMRVNEDIALARLAKRSGHLLRVVQNDDLYRTRMYATPAQAWRGWSRIFLGSLRSPGRLTIALGLMLFFSLQPWIGATIGWIARSLAEPARASAWGTIALTWTGVIVLKQIVVWRLYKVFRTPPAWSFTYLAGCVVTLAMLFKAFLACLGIASTVWRGTSYHRGRASRTVSTPTPRLLLPQAAEEPISRA